MKNIKNILFIFLFASIVGWGPFSFNESPSTNYGIFFGSNNSIASETRIISAQENTLSPAALKTALLAYQNARAKGLDDKQILTIIDFTRPSSEQRLLVVDMKTEKVLINSYVAHGSGSGDVYATSFSNDPQSLKSSLGVFETSDVYSGKHGESLRVKGLEAGFNDNAYRRNVVFHSAAYVGSEIAKERGRLGRSWGCMAVSPDTIRPLINAIKGNTLVVAYYSSQPWLSGSKFL